MKMALSTKMAVVLVVLSACLLVCSEAASQRKVVSSGGTRRWNDMMLYNETIKASAGIYKKAYKKVCFPEVKNYPRVNITSYSVLDLGKGGSVKLTSGGINSTQVCFGYEAKNFYTGFKFLTIIWGRYNR